MRKCMRSLLLIVFVFALAGCSSGSKTGSPAPGTSTPSGSAETIVLEFPSWQAEEPGFSQWWKELISQFEQEHPNVRINFTSIPFKGYVDTLITMFAADDPPDIVHLPSASLLQFANNDWLEPLDEILKETDVPQTWTSLQSNMVLDGKTQGLLLLGYGFNLYYNEKMLNDAGVAVPTTPEELLGAAETLTKDGVYGFGSTTVEMDNVFNEVSMFIVGEGNPWIKDGKYNLTDEKVVEAVEQYRKLLKMSPQGVSVEQKRQLFFDGKIAMIIDGPFIYGQATSDQSAAGPYIRIAPAPFPHIPGSVSNNLSIAKSIDPDKKRMVGEFIKLAASPEWQAKYAEYTNSPVPRAGVISEEYLKEHPEMGVFAESAKNAVSIIPDSINVRTNFNQFSKTVQTAMMELMVTDTPTADVLRKLEDQLGKIVTP
mgnify:CR=1 FL=1